MFIFLCGKDGVNNKFLSSSQNKGSDLLTIQLFVESKIETKSKFSYKTLFNDN